MIAAESIRARPSLKRMTSVKAVWLAPAAAGVFAGAAFFDLLPSATGAIGVGALLWTAAGLATMIAARKVVNRPDRRWIGWAAALGIWLHSLLEGVAAGTGVGAGTEASMLLSIGVLVHLVPESLALFAVITSTGGSARRAIAFCAVPWALVFIGFAGSGYLTAGLAQAPLGRAMAFGGGLLVCLAYLSFRQSAGSKLKVCSVAGAGLLWVAAQHLG